MNYEVRYIPHLFVLAQSVNILEEVLKGLTAPAAAIYLANVWLAAAVWMAKVTFESNDRS